MEGTSAEEFQRIDMALGETRSDLAAGNSAASDEEYDTLQLSTRVSIRLHIVSAEGRPRQEGLRGYQHDSKYYGRSET